MLKKTIYSENKADKGEVSESNNVWLPMVTITAKIAG